MKTFITRIAKRSICWWLVFLLGLLPTYSFALCRAEDATESPPVFDFLIDVSGSMNDQIPLSIQPNLTKASKLFEIKNRLAKLCTELPVGHRVLVSVFDHERREVCDIVLRTKADRDRLIKAVASIISRDGSTYLWRSVDEELTRASQLAASTSQRARLVIYSDGEDMEKNPNFTHKTILDKHGKMIQTSLNLDWVTLGYDLTPTIKTEFERAGANVVRAVTVEQLMPLRSAFLLSNATIEAGQIVTISDQSTGIQIVKQLLDFGDGQPAQKLSLLQGRFPDVVHTFELPGNYQITLSTETSSGQKNSSSRRISVAKKEWVMPTIRTDVKQPKIDQPIRFSADSSVNGLRMDWRFSDGTTDRCDSVVWIPKKPGKYTVELIATDVHGESKSQQRSFTVPNPALPKVNILLSKPTVAIGESVVLKADPIVESVEYAWTADNGTHGKGPITQLVFDKPGTHEIQVVVCDSFGQSGSATTHVEVNPPAPPKAVFRLASSRLEPGQQLIAMNESPISASGFVWNLNGQQISQSRNLEYKLPAYGDFKLELVAMDDFGQSTVAAELVKVPLPPPPRPGFAVGAKQIRLGDPLSVMHACTGKIDSIEYEFTDLPSVRVKYPFDTENCAMEIAPVQLGTFAIKQMVTGPGGTASATSEVEVLSKWAKQVADFRIENLRSKGRLEARFINVSQGDVMTCEFDAGDGSPIQTVRGAVDFVHAYGPGNWHPTVTVYGPNDAGLPPSVWRGQPISVANPTPKWIANLIWQLPIAMGFALGSIGLAKLWARRQERRDSMLVHGHLSIRPIDEPLTVYDFDLDGLKSNVEISLPDHTVVKIASLADGNAAYDESRPTEYSVEIERANQLGSSQGRLREDEEVEIGDYALMFSK